MRIRYDDDARFCKTRCKLSNGRITAEGLSVNGVEAVHVPASASRVVSVPVQYLSCAQISTREVVMTSPVSKFR